MQYVVGFLINKELRTVALVRKLRPNWQKGRLNGIGGKIEPGELPLEAMRREFREETGYDSIAWKHFCTLEGEHDPRVIDPDADWRVYLYYEFTDTQLSYLIHQATDEEIVIRSIDVVTGLHVTSDCLPNLTWLIPMALNMEKDRANSFHIWERYNAGHLKQD